MSNHLRSQTDKRRVGNFTQTAVLAYLCDKASDDGSGIWASKQTIADEMGTTKPTIRSALRDLMAAGLVSEVGQKKNSNGYTVEYAIDVEVLEALPLVACHQRKEDAKITGKGALPVKDIDRSSGVTTPGKAALPKPLLEPDPLSTPDGVDAPPAGSKDDLGVGQEDEAGAPAAPPKTKTDKPYRLPDDWQAPKVEDLQPEARALVLQWPAGAYPVQCAKFVNHWTAINRTKRTERGWRATLSNWLVSSHAEVMRAAKAGVSFAALVPSKSLPVRAVTPVRAKDREDSLSTTMHATLRSALGVSVHDQWFKCCALLMDVRRALLTVVTPTPFVAQWVEQYYSDRLETIAQGFTNGARANVKYKVERKKPDASA